MAGSTCYLFLIDKREMGYIWGVTSGHKDEVIINPHPETREHGEHPGAGSPAFQESGQQAPHEVE
ncbi:MAG: hypothetical protein AB1611_15225 [bacterium]